MHTFNLISLRWKIDGKYVRKGFREENDTSYLTFLLTKNISVSCEASNSKGSETQTAFVIASGKITQTGFQSIKTE